MPNSKDKGCDNPGYFKTNIKTIPKKHVQHFKIGSNIVKNHLRILQKYIRTEKASLMK